MGNCCGKTKTPVSIIQNDTNIGTPSANDHLFQNTEEISLGPMTGFFQNTGKNIPEGIQNNVGTPSEASSDNVVGSQKFVKENDGLEITDVQ
ncbi:Hypothetical predicted protein [Podarcis lilfordi]|uniref:Uncharacterized protein n=1 Tax=Podarcis lilfordi TaxID=74358 RepID=A0AA35K767_9SAUR|nr:Hypothetical predicted protein [Podarcis lilfordi]